MSTPSNQELTLETLGHLQQLVIGLVSKLGAERTTALLESIHHFQEVDAEELQRERLLIDFLKVRAIIVFSLREGELYSSNIAEYRDARMACYHLLKTHTSLSYPMIAELFESNKRSVMHYYHKAESFLKAPRYYRDFTEKYQLLHRSLLEFIAQLNDTPDA